LIKAIKGEKMRISKDEKIASIEKKGT